MGPGRVPGQAHRVLAAARATTSSGSRSASLSPSGTSRPPNRSGSAKGRAWSDQHQGVIASWEDFERYPWPKVEEFDFFPFEYIDAHLPDGMGMITCHGGGIYEHLSWIMSYEGLCLALFDKPDLVKAWVADRIGGLLVQFYGHLLDLGRVIAVFQGDDMGFKTATLISPQHLREYILPWHRRYAELAHRGARYILHSCGNLTMIMPDLVDAVGIDAKHSFEDAIIPAPEFQERYGSRIAVLGGLDIDILTREIP